MSGYNQTSASDSVRIGNWFEESKLRDDTGIRYYPSPKARGLDCVTKQRCIEHSDQQLPKDYISTVQETIVKPQNHPEYGVKVNPVGPRQRMLQEKLRNDINEDFKAREQSDFTETRKVNYVSSTQAGYLHPPFKQSARSIDGSNRVPTRNTNYSTDSAVTYYSHAVANRSQEVKFPTTFVGSTNPFKRSSAFSVDPRKEVFARKAETNERPNPLPIMRDFIGLNSLRERVYDCARLLINSDLPDGRTVRAIIGVIWGENSSGYIPLPDLEAILSAEYDGLTLSPNERQGLISACDLRCNNTISLVELTNLFRQTPSPRRLELIDLFFSSLDLTSAAVIEHSVIRNRMSVQSPSLHADAFLSAMNISHDESSSGTITLDDFYDYYIDVSNEVGDDHVKFEEILHETWGSL